MSYVFHNKNRINYEFEGAVPELSDLDLVAVLPKNTSAEEAFRLTNSIDTPWWENEVVHGMFFEIPGKLSGCRSTSVGDVFVDNSGAAYIVHYVGFKRWESGDAICAEAWEDYLEACEDLDAMAKS